MKKTNAEKELEFTLAKMRYYRSLIEGGFEERVRILKQTMQPAMQAIQKLRRDRARAEAELDSMRSSLTALHMNMKSGRRIDRLAQVKKEISRLEENREVYELAAAEYAIDELQETD